MSQQFKEGDRVVADRHPDFPQINGQPGTVISISNTGMFLEIPPDTTLYYATTNELTFFNLCSTITPQNSGSLISAQELGQDLPLPDIEPETRSPDFVKLTSSVDQSSTSDTPEFPSMTTSPKRRGRTLKQTSSPPAPPINPSQSKEIAEEPMTPKTASPTSNGRSKKSNQDTSPLKTSPAYSQSTAGTTSKKSSNGRMTAGTMQNGSLSVADTLAPPTLENGYSFLESPGALAAGTSGANPPGQSRLEAQLRKNGLIGSGEVSSPDFLEVSLGLPVGWTDPQVNGTASELLARTAPPENAAKPSETSSIPELLSSPSIASSTTIREPDSTSDRSLRCPELAEESLADRSLSVAEVKWVSPDEIELVSATQIRAGVDAEAIARYTEMMQAGLWNFDRRPLPVLFAHEGRYLVGDGHHRIEAARKVGADIQCEIFTAAVVEDAILYSITAIENTNHGLPLRPKDQRKRIIMFLDLLESNTIRIDRPDGFDLWSSRAIATYLRLPESGYRTVASIRKDRELAKELNGKPPGAISQQPKKLLEAIDPTPPLPFDPPTPLAKPLPWRIANHEPLPAEPLTKEKRTALKLEEQFSGGDATPTIGLEVDLENTIDYTVRCLYRMTNAQIAELKEAIEQEEARRLTAIMEENT